MYDASRGTFRVACLLFVFLQGAWSCLFWNMNLKGTPRSFCAGRGCAGNKARKSGVYQWSESVLIVMILHLGGKQERIR